MRTTVLILGACLLVSACESMPRHHESRRPQPVTPIPGETRPTDPLARSATFVCEDNSTITLTEGDRAARAMLNSGLQLALDRRGTHYGARPYEFRHFGSNGEFHANGKVFRCRQK